MTRAESKVRWVMSWRTGSDHLLRSSALQRVAGEAAPGPSLSCGGTGPPAGGQMPLNEGHQSDYYCYLFAKGLRTTPTW